MKFSPVASLYSISAALMSVCCKYHIVDGLRKSKVTMSYRSAIKGKEYWRLGTSMLLFDLDNPLDVYTLVVLFTSLSALERRLFKGSPSGMITALIFMATLLLAPGFYIRELRLKEPSVMLFIGIVTWATISCMGRPSRDGLVTSLASLVPLVAPHFRKGDVDLALLKHQGLAVAAGLACVMLIPDVEGERVMRKRRQLIAKQKSRAAAVAEALAAGGGGGGGNDNANDSSEEEQEDQVEEEVESSEEEDEDSD